MRASGFLRFSPRVLWEVFPARRQRGLPTCLEIRRPARKSFARRWSRGVPCFRIAQIIRGGFAVPAPPANRLQGPAFRELLTSRPSPPRSHLCFTSNEDGRTARRDVPALSRSYDRGSVRTRRYLRPVRSDSRESRGGGLVLLRFGRNGCCVNVKDEALPYKTLLRTRPSTPWPVHFPVLPDTRVQSHRQRSCGELSHRGPNVFSNEPR